MAFTVVIEQSNESFLCSGKDSILQGMAKLGRKGIPVGCVNGGCGVCKIRIRKGVVDELGPVSRQHVIEEESSQGVTLACRVAPRSNLEIEVIGKMQKSFLSQFVTRK